MKSLLSICFLAAVGCNQQKKADEALHKQPVAVMNTPQQQAAVKNNHAILTEYKDYLKSLDKEQPNHVKAAILNYQWLFKKRDTTLCDSGYALFNGFYEEVGSYMQNHQSPEDIPQKRKNEVLQQLKQYGFSLEAAEGTLIYTNDRDSINPKFYPFVSATMQQFMRQQHRETNAVRSNAEGSMAISPEAFTERYIFWQRFAQQHPHFLLSHWAFAYARSYAEELVFGMENTPLQVDGAITDTYNKIYQLLTNKYGHEKFAACYTKYYEALKNNDTPFIETFKEKFRSAGSDAVYPQAE